MIQSEADMRQRLLAARLPAMPQILLKLLELCQADGAGMAEMAKLVANDAGMTVKILDVANSAAFQRGGQKAGLLQALNLLGSDMIKTLVINASVSQAINGFSAGCATDLRRFWKHALGTAVMAREIARAMDYAHAEEAYLAGLLHDVGRLALLVAAPDEYLVNFQAQDDGQLCEAELQTLHMNHVQAGTWVVERWQLDSFLGDAILYHHEPAKRLEGAHALVRLVHLAHQLASHDLAQPVPQDLGALCQIDAANLQAIAQGAASQVQKAASYLGVNLDGVDALPVQQAVMPKALQADAAQLKLGEEVRDLTLLNQLGQIFVRQKTDQQLLTVVRQHAQLFFKLEHTAIFLMNGSGQALMGAAAAEQQQRLLDFSLNLATGGAIAEAVQQGRIGFFGRDDGATSVVQEQLLRIFGSEHVLCLPMLQGRLCLGLLLAGVAGGQVLELELVARERFLLAFAAQAAAALQATAEAAQSKGPAQPAGPSTGSGSEASDVDQRIARIKQEHRDSARRVVHEVNNPLAIIKNYLSVLDDKLARQQPVGGEIGVLHEEIDRIGNIMGEFAGAAPTPQRVRAEINQTVSRTVQLLRDTGFLPPSVELVVQPAPQNCELDASGDTLKQILLNLVKNSVEAMPKGGRIEIVNNGQVQRKGRVLYAICVSDDGPGIPAEHRSKLFAPVQSAKPGSNRGIGLSIVQGLVMQLGGSIACVSSSTMGTMFEVCLPVPVDLQTVAPFPAAVQDLA
jgi:HD-like signal output (HDOD) protein